MKIHTATILQITGVAISLNSTKLKKSAGFVGQIILKFGKCLWPRD